MALTLADINNNRLRSDPQPTKWTFETMDDHLKQAKAILQYHPFVPYQDLSSIRVGIHQQKIEFIARTMWNHSRYFFAFAVPTVCYMDQFLQDTKNIMFLNKDEVEAFEFVIGWCHEGGRPDAQHLHRRENQRSLHQWVCTWRVADLLGVPILQYNIARTVMLKMADRPQLPRGVTVRYLYEKAPYKLKEDFLWQAFLVRFAHSPGSALDLNPELFPPMFVQDVRTYRRIHKLKKPDEIDAFTRPPVQHMKGQAKDDTYWKHLQRYKDQQAVRLGRRKSESVLNTEMYSVGKEEKLPS